MLFLQCSSFCLNFAKLRENFNFAMTLFQKLPAIGTFCIKRCISSTSFKKAYEPDGKTTVTILNRNFDYGLMVDGVFENGFALNNNIKTIGPMAIFPKTVMSWNIANSESMDEASLSLFLSLEPKLDILIIGLDAVYPQDAPFIKNTRALLKSYNINSEITPVFHAVSVFNFLNAERRCMAGAFIPPKTEYRLEMERIANEPLKYVKEFYKGTDEMDPMIPKCLDVHGNLNQQLMDEEEERKRIISNPRPAKKPPIFNKKNQNKIYFDDDEKDPLISNDYYYDNEKKKK